MPVAPKDATGRTYVFDCFCSLKQVSTWATLGYDSKWMPHDVPSSPVLGQTAPPPWRSPVEESQGALDASNGRERTILKRYAKTWLTMDLVIVLSDWSEVVFSSGGRSGRSRCSGGRGWPRRIDACVW